MADPADTGEPVTAVVAGRAPEGALPGGAAAATESLVVTVYLRPDTASRSSARPTASPAARWCRRTCAASPRRGPGLARARHHDRGGGGDDHRGRGLTLGAPRRRSTTGPSRPAGRITSIRGASKPTRTRPPSRRVRGADPPVGAEGEPVDRPAQPLRDAARATGPIGNSDTRVPGARSIASSRRAEEAEVLAADQHHRLRRDTSPARSSPRGGGRSARRESRAR